MPYITWSGENSKIIDNETVKSDVVDCAGQQIITVGIHSDNASPTASTKLFVQLKIDGKWFFANLLPNTDLQAESGETGKSGSIALIGGIRAFKLQVTTTQSETITAEYYMKTG